MEMNIENSIGMALVSLPAGRFSMGQKDGDWDEVPVHEVRITTPFFMSDAPVTNAQFERFRKDHARYRGIACVGEADDAAALFVTWDDAVAFCNWLSEKEGKPYRLPTEAEWEYACRAGTTTQYWTGDTLPAEHRIENPDDWKVAAPVDDSGDPVATRRRPANPFGLHDMHGLVEEWCLDWYGPYIAGAQVDPVGYKDGDCKVTRGGSYETLAWHLRSANRLAALPEDKSRFIGFRVVQASMPGGAPLDPPPPPAFFRGVQQLRHDWQPAVDMDKPFFAAPVPYVIEPDLTDDEPLVPFYKHSHCPAITWCDNGDLIACWFNTMTERGREMNILSSRLRRGQAAWEPASLFFKAADRNMTGSSLFNAGGRIMHFNGMEEAQTWTNLILVLRESADDGATWSKPRVISAEHEGLLHRTRNQVIACTRQLRDGTLLQLCDARQGGGGGTAVHASKDGGKTWRDLGLGRPFPSFKAGTTGAWIAGIHASAVELANGSLLAFGRGDTIDGKMPASTSTDGGATWTYSPSPFPPIGGGQRLVLMRLLEGPLLFIGFTGERRRDGGDVDGIEIADASGNARVVHGMFSALSFDEAKSWTCKRLVSDGDARGRVFPSADFIRSFTMDATHAEPAGYLAAVQAPDGMVHLISSHLHYRFNLAWLRSPMV
ncbi:MAG: SUMF1/EgtB/PvdO family nonheme iron enzyme [Candidatus Lokiarchaeota archaeon]|nr:SUMF1/EgtB/PvdO family nonheme iron enzyme [Candidatus Lokiarchaeota archaeon]